MFLESFARCRLSLLSPLIRNEFSFMNFVGRCLLCAHYFFFAHSIALCVFWIHSRLIDTHQHSCVCYMFWGRRTRVKAKKAKQSRNMNRTVNAVLCFSSALCSRSTHFPYSRFSILRLPNRCIWFRMSAAVYSPKSGEVSLPIQFDFYSWACTLCERVSCFACSHISLICSPLPMVLYSTI